MGKIVIVDDQILHARRLETALLQYFEGEIIILTEYDELYLQNTYIDIVFMDIDLKDENGIIRAQQLRKHKRYGVEIIFYSSYEKYEHDSLIVDPAYFIRKHYLETDLENAVKVLNNKNKKQKRMVDLGEYRMLVSNIIYIESLLHYKRVVLVGGKMLKIRETMPMLEKHFEEYHFIRCHRSYIVNADHILQYTGKKILLSNQHKIMITDTYSLVFRQKYAKFIEQVATYQF